MSTYDPEQPKEDEEPEVQLTSLSGISIESAYELPLVFDC